MAGTGPASGGVRGGRSGLWPSITVAGVTRRLEKIEWLDHLTYESNAAWHSLEDIEALEPVTCYTVGWVMKETRKYITVVSTLSTDGGAKGEFTIIKGAVVKRTVLEE
jgi:hypothetical protein